MRGETKRCIGTQAVLKECKKCTAGKAIRPAVPAVVPPVPVSSANHVLRRPIAADSSIIAAVCKIIYGAWGIIAA